MQERSVYRKLYGLMFNSKKSGKKLSVQETAVHLQKFGTKVNKRVLKGYLVEKGKWFQ